MEEDNDDDLDKKEAIDFVKMLNSLEPRERARLRQTPELVAAEFVSKRFAKHYPMELAAIRTYSGIGRLWLMHDADEGRGTLGRALGCSCDSRSLDRCEGLLHDILSATSPADVVENSSMEIAIARLKQSGIPVGWVRLIIDLKSWSHVTRKVQATWAKDFYMNIGAGSPA